MSRYETFMVTSIIMVVIGLVIRYIVARRRFNRRAATGLEGFRSYEHACVARYLESFARLIAIILIILGLLGNLMVITSFSGIY